MPERLSDHRTHVVTDGAGRGSVEVDGQDISRHVVGLDIRIRVGQLDEVTVGILSATDVSTYAAPEYLAQAFGGSGSGPTPIAAVRSLLESLEQLDRIDAAPSSTGGASR